MRNKHSIYSIYTDETEAFTLLSRRLEESDKVESQKQIKI